MIENGPRKEQKMNKNHSHLKGERNTEHSLEGRTEECRYWSEWWRRRGEPHAPIPTCAYTSMQHHASSCIYLTLRTSLLNYHNTLVYPPILCNHASQNRFFFLSAQRRRRPYTPSHKPFFCYSLLLSCQKLRSLRHQGLKQPSLNRRRFWTLWRGQEGARPCPHTSRSFPCSPEVHQWVWSCCQRTDQVRWAPCFDLFLLQN